MKFFYDATAQLKLYSFQLKDSANPATQHAQIVIGANNAGGGGNGAKSPSISVFSKSRKINIT